MLNKLDTSTDTSPRTTQRQGVSLQFILWCIWTLVVLGSALLHARDDMLAQHAIDVLAIIINAFLIGSIGLVVMTALEIWIEPWRFID